MASLDLNASGIKQGSKGEAVKSWQNMLNRVGAKIRLQKPLIEDGIFGAATTTATIALQRFVGVPADGKVGPKTLQAYRNNFPMIATNITLPSLSVPYKATAAYKASKANVAAPSQGSLAKQANKPVSVPTEPPAPAPQKASSNILMYALAGGAALLVMLKMKKGK